MIMFNNDYDILNLAELAEELQIGMSYAYKLVNTKKINAFRVGKSWRIPRSSIKDFIDKSVMDNQNK